MDNFLLAYVSQRMKAMGFDNYTFEPIRVTKTALFGFQVDLTIDAYNEYYFLISEMVEPTLIIRSDTNIFNESADYSSFQYYGIQEFTGSIQITQAVSIDLEFLRVIPVIKMSEAKQKIIDNYLQNVKS